MFSFPALLTFSCFNNHELGKASLNNRLDNGCSFGEKFLEVAADFGQEQNEKLVGHDLVVDDVELLKERAAGGDRVQVLFPQVDISWIINSIRICDLVTLFKKLKENICLLKYTTLLSFYIYIRKLV